MKYKFGRLYKPDERDKLFLLRPDHAKALEVKRKFWVMGIVCDQVGPSCVGNAWYGWLWAFPVKNRWMPFDATELYHQAQKYDDIPGENYEGSTIRGGASFLHHEGYVTEYNWACNIEDIIAHILTVGPLVMGTSWYRGMLDPDSDGYLHVSGNIEGGHAYVFLGASRVRKNPDGSLGAFRILNSWGRSWGEQGRAWISLNDVAKLMSEYDSEACTATEVKK